jgi:hypothetical protein
MIWVRLLLLTSFLAQQTMCCCGAGCGAQNDLSEAACEFEVHQADQLAQKLEERTVISPCKHCHHASNLKEAQNNTSDYLVTADDAWHEAADSPHQHDHHLCVATHLFYIAATPVSAPKGIDFDGPYVTVLAGSEAIGRLTAWWTASNRARPHLSIPDRSALQVYTI